MKTFKSIGQKEDLLKKLAAYQALGAFYKVSWQTVNNIEDVEYKWLTSPKINGIKKFSELYEIDLWYCKQVRTLFRRSQEMDINELPYKAIEILPVGFDFNKAKSAFYRGILLKLLEGVEYSLVRKALSDCADLFLVPFDKTDQVAARSVRNAARSAKNIASFSASDPDWSAAILGSKLAEEAAGIAWGPVSARSEWLTRSANATNWVWIRDFLFECIKNN